MRVTQKTKEETRRRILDSGRKLFIRKGFDATTTRDLAAASHIAAGTLFNYFPSKEALAMALIAEALAAASADYDKRRRHGSESLAEDLFAFIAAGLRRLEPCRRFVGDAVETAMSPFRRADVDAAASSAQSTSFTAEDTRIDHLEQVASIIARHLHPRSDDVADSLSATTPALGAAHPSFAASSSPTDPVPMLLHLYWTLYLGILAYWSRDDSPNQENTLAVLDQWIQLFVAALTPQSPAVAPTIAPRPTPAARATTQEELTHVARPQ